MRGNGSLLGPVVQAYARYLSGLAIRPCVDACLACHREIHAPATGTQRRTLAPTFFSPTSSSSYFRAPLAYGLWDMKDVKEDQNMYIFYSGYYRSLSDSMTGAITSAARIAKVVISFYDSNFIAGST